MSKHNKEADLLYVRTPRGLAMKIHSSQIRASKLKRYKQPTYTSDELYEWLISQPDWNVLFYAWKESKYDKMLIPSVDRINSLLGYTFSNIQLLTWKKNRDKGYIENGLLHGKGVLQLDSDMNIINTYTSLREASKLTGIHRGNILKVCQEVRELAGGYKWIRMK